MDELDNKDKIIFQQLDVIRAMTENNLKRVGDDFFGAPVKKSAQEKAGGMEKAKGAPEQAPEDKPPETIEQLKAELQSYIGLSSVKREVENLINTVTVHNMRKEHGLPIVDMSLHMVFSGNPGTGKTMIARLMARVYKCLNILSKGQLIEVDRSGLVAGYIGQTAIKTSEAIERAKGGVLFIDEAYALTSKSENDFGFEAVDTLLKAMEDNREDLIVIVAGYDGLMDEFVHSNPGLESRFNRFLHFADYSQEELFEVLMLQCKKGCYELDKGAKEAVREYIREESVHPISFGNARGVRNIFEKLLVSQANRLARMDAVTKDDLLMITAEDVMTAKGEPLSIESSRDPVISDE